MESNNIVSKVLVHEVCNEAQGYLKTFCQQQNLVGLKDTTKSIMDIFHLHTDLGAAFLCEGVDDDGNSGLEIGTEISTRNVARMFIKNNIKTTTINTNASSKAVLTVVTACLTKSA